MTWAEQIRDALDEDRFVLLRPADRRPATRRAHPVRAAAADARRRRRADPARRVPARRRALRPDRRRSTAGSSSRAIDMLAEQRAGGRDLRFEVNLSGRSLGDPELLDARSSSDCATTDVDPPGSIFEVTETAAVVEHRRARGTSPSASRSSAAVRARRLRRRLRLLLLPQAPAVRLPQDRRRVRPPLRRQPTDQLVSTPSSTSRAAWASARSPSSSTPETLELLAGLGVDYAQGFHLGRPAPLASTWPPDEAPR